MPLKRKKIKKNVKKVSSAKKLKPLKIKKIEKKEKKKEKNVGQIIKGENIFVEVPGSRSDVLRILAKYGISGVPVVSRKTKRLVGVVTRTDILRRPEEQQLALLMTSNPVVIRHDAQLKKAVRIFHERRIHTLPVVDKKGTLLGTIRPMDVLNEYAESPKRVSDCVSRCAVPVYQETPVPVVMSIFNITRTNALPVLDENGKLSGMVADGDLFNLSTEETKTVLSRFGIGRDEDEWSWEGIRDAVLLYHQTTRAKMPNVPVKKVMVKNPISVFKDALISVAIWKMRKYNFNQLPVVDEQNNLVGMVSDLDIMGALIE